ncbi:MAG: 16S rRNA (cytosine(1402)-N(4))-methyltransferase RsmH [Candidatus Paceibacterota bacterium]|jgi:16S rRNA (cytosine1402-N4)-methyltransferase
MKNEKTGENLMSKSTTGHKPVLLKESIEGLEIKPGDVFFDGTLGSAGHSEKVCKLYGKEVRIIGTDLDEDALIRATEKLEKNNCNFSVHHFNYRNLDKVLEELGIEEVDKILLDLGISSDQLEVSGRGFSFQKNEPLLMTMKKEITENDLTAKEIVNTWDEENIADIIYGYGEEKFSRSIAKKIFEARKEKPIETTFELVEIVKSAVPSFYRRGRINPATKTFQALRITVNDEMEGLKEALLKGFNHLKKGGRMAVISFHSLEDRLVKNFYKEKKELGFAKLINKKPMIPSEEEIRENGRSRSSKLRILEKII